MSADSIYAYFPTTANHYAHLSPIPWHFLCLNGRLKHSLSTNIYIIALPVHQSRLLSQVRLDVSPSHRLISSNFLDPLISNDWLATDGGLEISAKVPTDGSSRTPPKNALSLWVLDLRLDRHAKSAPLALVYTNWLPRYKSNDTLTFALIVATLPGSAIAKVGSTRIMNAEYQVSLIHEHLCHLRIKSFPNGFKDIKMIDREAMYKCQFLLLFSRFTIDVD
jgi:hypothetical protein